MDGQDGVWWVAEDVMDADWLIQTGQSKGWLLIGSLKAPMNLIHKDGQIHGQGCFSFTAQRQPVIDHALALPYPQTVTR